jgi:hypothetical protein
MNLSLFGSCEIRISVGILIIRDFPQSFQGNAILQVWQQIIRCHSDFWCSEVRVSDSVAKLASNKQVWKFSVKSSGDSTKIWKEFSWVQI